MEVRDVHPHYAVSEAEYFRLLGYPRGHEPGDRARELMAWARDWYAQNGRPWIYFREAALQNLPTTLSIDGVQFHSPRLQEHFRQHDVRSTVLVAVSAGRECEEHAQSLWRDGKPDEYFFLEMFGSAVVEDLVARLSGRICDEAAHHELMAVPHYSPGYTGWDVAEQNKLFDLISRGLAGSLPGPIEVLSSGMLRPKKSLLGVFGLALSNGRARAEVGATPCENCAFTPCHYRRMPYRHTASAGAAKPTRGLEQPAPVGEPLTRGAAYSVNARALRKWATERVRLESHDDGSVDAVFRFDGTTCSNLGQPLAFDYRVSLSGPDEGYRIRSSTCAPAPGDAGYQATCAYIADPDEFMQAIATEKPLLDRPLDEVLSWSRASAPSGCHCAAASRAHKWGLALEAIHYALVQARTPQSVS